MTGTDIAGLLQPCPEDGPYGTNLEYDKDFTFLVGAAAGKPERVMGNKVIEADPPDWRAVRQRSIDLFQRTKDLRVAMYLLRSLLAIEGLSGFRDGLEVIDRLLAEYWQGVHPTLDPDLGDDPTERISALTDLTSADTVLKDLRLAPLVRSPALGSVCYRDVALATGELKPVAGGTVRDLAEVKAIFLGCDAAELLATAAAASGCLASLRNIERTLSDKVTARHSLDLAAPLAAVNAIVRFLQARIEERGLATAAEVAPGDLGAEAVAESAPPAARPVRSASGEITCRDDVVRLLDRICAYYAEAEPSSPVPLLLTRAKRLATKDFISVLQDIAPDAVSIAEALRGRDE